MDAGDECRVGDDNVAKFAKLDYNPSVLQQPAVNCKFLWIFTAPRQADVNLPNWGGGGPLCLIPLIFNRRFTSFYTTCVTQRFHKNMEKFQYHFYAV